MCVCVYVWVCKRFIRITAWYSCAHQFFTTQLFLTHPKWGSSCKLYLLMLKYLLRLICFTDSFHPSREYYIIAGKSGDNRFLQTIRSNRLPIFSRFGLFPRTVWRNQWPHTNQKCTTPLRMTKVVKISLNCTASFILGKQDGKIVTLYNILIKTVMGCI